MAGGRARARIKDNPKHTFGIRERVAAATAGGSPVHGTILYLRTRTSRQFSALRSCAVVPGSFFPSRAHVRSESEVGQGNHDLWAWFSKVAQKPTHTHTHTQK